MNDRDFLMWLHARLEKVHGENAYYDYMHKLRAIIKATPIDKVTPNMQDGLEGEEIVKATETIAQAHAPAIVADHERGEPVAWMFQHVETGNVIFFNIKKDADNFAKSNSRFGNAIPLYTK